MVPKLYMFSLRMEGLVLCKMNGTLVVNVEPTILLLISIRGILRSKMGLLRGIIK